MIEKNETSIKNALSVEDFEYFEKQKNILAELEQTPEEKKTSDEKKAIAICLSNIGNTLMARAVYTLSIDYYIRSLNILEKLEDNQDIWNLRYSVTNSLGSSYPYTPNLDNFSEVEKHLMQALEHMLCKPFFRHLLLNQYRDLADLFIHRRRNIDRISEPEQIREEKLYSELYNRKEISGEGYANRLSQLGHLYLSKGQSNRAKLFFKEAINCLKEEGSQFRTDLAALYVQLALIEQQKLLLSEAMANFLSALNCLTPTNPSHAMAYLNYSSQLASVNLECGEFNEILSILPQIISALSEVQFVLPQQASIDLLKAIKTLLGCLFIAHGQKNSQLNLAELNTKMDYFCAFKSDNTALNELIPSDINIAYEDLIRIIYDLAKVYKTENNNLSMVLFTLATVIFLPKEKAQYQTIRLEIVDSHFEQGLYFFNQKFHTKAADNFIKAIQIANQIPEHEKTINYYKVLSNIYYKKLLLELATTPLNSLHLSLYFVNALNIFDEKELEPQTQCVIWHYKIIISYAMASYYAERKNISETDYYYRKLSNLFNSIPSNLFASLEFVFWEIYKDVGGYYYKARDFKEAEVFLKKSINAIEKKVQCLILPLPISNEFTVLQSYALLMSCYANQGKSKQLTELKNKTLSKLKLILEERCYKNQNLSMLSTAREFYKYIYSHLSQFTGEQELKDFLRSASLIFTENNQAILEKITVFHGYVSKIKDFDQFSSSRRLLVHVVEVVLLAAEKELLPDSTLKKSLKDPEILENLKGMITEIEERHQLLKELIGTHPSLLDALIYRDRDQNRRIENLESEINLLKNKSEPDNSSKLKRKNDEQIDGNNTKKSKVSNAFFAPYDTQKPEKKSEDSAKELGF